MIKAKREIKNKHEAVSVHIKDLYKVRTRLHLAQYTDSSSLPTPSLRKRATSSSMPLLRPELLSLCRTGVQHRIGYRLYITLHALCALHRARMCSSVLIFARHRGRLFISSEGSLLYGRDLRLVSLRPMLCGSTVLRLNKSCFSHRGCRDDLRTSLSTRVDSVAKDDHLRSRSVSGVPPIQAKDVMELGG